MKSENVAQKKSYALALRMVRLNQHLVSTRKEFVLSRQLLRCGTSVGANVEEALGAQSRADFVSKTSVAYKEARETKYWLRLLKDTDYLTPAQFDSVHADAAELCRILASILKTTKGTPRPSAPPILNS